MTVDREDLVRSFDTFDMPEPAFDRLVDRRTRRRRRARIEAGIAAVVIVALTASVLIHSLTTTRLPANRGPHLKGPAWTTADLRGLIFTNPGGWHLTAYINGFLRDAVLTNLPPDFSASDPCTGMKSDEALLRIHPTYAPTEQTWPVDLKNDASGSGLACGADALHAAWSAGNATFEAEATFGPDVSERDRAALLHAFSALTLAAPHRAVSLGARCAPQFSAVKTTAEVLDADTSGPIPWTELGSTGSSCVTERGAAVRRSGDSVLVATAMGYELGVDSSTSLVDGARGLDVHDYKADARALVTGVVGKEVARVVLVTTDGRRVRARLVGSRMVKGAQAYFAPFGDLPTGIVTTYDGAGNALQAARFSPGMDCADDPGQCLLPIAPGATIAASYPAEHVAWLLRERAGSVQLLDGSGAVMASETAGDRMAATAVRLPGTNRQVVFGVAPAGTAVVMPKIPRVGWGIMPIAQLRDGTIVFWNATSQLGETLAVAAFDASCHPLGAVDPLTGAPIVAPTEQACLGSGGGS